MGAQPLGGISEKVIAPYGGCAGGGQVLPLVHCPHCGAENFTMEGWEDLDHCSSCGKPLAEPMRNPFDAAGFAAHVGGVRRMRHQGDEGQREEKLRRA